MKSIVKSIPCKTRESAIKTLKSFVRKERKRTKKSLPPSVKAACEAAMTHSNYHVRRAGWELLGRSVPCETEDCVALAKVIAPNALTSLVAMFEALAKVFAFAAKHGAVEYSAAAE